MRGSEGIKTGVTYSLDHNHDCRRMPYPMRVTYIWMATVIIGIALLAVVAKLIGNRLPWAPIPAFIILAVAFLYGARLFADWLDQGYE
jgi:hypothetical protein